MLKHRWNIIFSHHFNVLKHIASRGNVLGYFSQLLIGSFRSLCSFARRDDKSNACKVSYLVHFPVVVPQSCLSCLVNALCILEFVYSRKQHLISDDMVRLGYFYLSTKSPSSQRVVHTHSRIGLMWKCLLSYACLRTKYPKSEAFQ